MPTLQKDILLMGPLANKQKPKQTGGAIVLFQNLLTELDQLGCQYLLIDTNKKNYSNIVVAYFMILSQLLIKQYAVKQISLHSSKDYIFLAPFLIIIGKLFGKKTSLRKFGGEVWRIYNSSKGFKRYILKYIFTNIDCLFLEIKSMVNNFKLLNQNTHWFPNVRIKPSFEANFKDYTKRLVFISHVKESKGIDEIVGVVKLLDSSYTIDIYGLIYDKKYSESFFKKHNISYKGSLLVEEVLPILATYDVLLLPTTWQNEGYPGIIIESYSMGKPIIATNLQGISEIVDNYKSGILIEQKNIESLKNAIEYFTETNYKEMSHFAKEKFDVFDSKKQIELFLNVLRNLEFPFLASTQYQ